MDNRAGGLESANALLSISYIASDPLAISIDDTGWVLPPGSIRIWKKNGDQPRSSALASDGGDYIAPGEYTLGELGIVGGQGTLYIETVRESAAEGDIVIGATMREDEDGAVVGTDLVRGTGTRIAIRATNYASSASFYGSTLVATHLHSADAPPPSGMTVGPWQMYRIHVSDPRPDLGPFQLGSVELPLERHGNLWESQQFWVWWPSELDAPVGMPSATMVPILDWPPSLPWHYDAANGVPRESNAQKKLRATVLTSLPREQQLIADAVVHVVREMEAEGWLPVNALDDGAYDKEVHRRAWLRLADTPNTYSQVWVNPQTRVVVSVGQRPANVTSLRELDILFTTDGYAPTVGQTLDRNKLVWAADIKTSVGSAVMDSAQKQFYSDMVGAKKWSVHTPLRTCTGAGWTDHPRGGQVYRILGLVGLATTAFAISNAAQYDSQLTTMIGAWEAAIDYSDEPNDREAYFAEFTYRFREYVKNFCADTTALDAVTLVVFLDYIGQEP